MTTPDAMQAASPLQRLKLYIDQNERHVTAISFAFGFVFDIVTAERIDSWLLIAQQVAYLAIITAILLQTFFAEGEPAPEPVGLPLFRRLYSDYHTLIVHFLLGSLLSLYTIFFFKSSSLVTSFGFLGVLVTLLVANESRRFKAMGLAIRFALFSICLLSFCAGVVPVFIGSVGMMVFIISMLVACIPIVVIYRRIRIHAPERQMQARRQILVPFGLVLTLFLGLYLFRLIPPVPLSIPFIGVYHHVERTEEHFRLSHERPAWRVWHNGDQKFRAQPGDRVFVFFRIFSPTRFADQVTLRWYWQEGSRGWALQDSIPIDIVGGRKEGFRGYGVKSNYQPGDWKLQVMTNDGREIGRIYFEIELVREAPRNFEIDVH
ncbi:MAG: DUF2914 domain-containing protein [Burkholderiales bacterium]